MEFVEMEVKFHLQDLKEVKQRLQALGAESGGRFFEKNIRYDDAQKRLLARRSLLRLRRDEKDTLTFKSPPAVEETEVKALNELEVEVSSLEVTARILEALGFFPEQVYEKWRETFTLGKVAICLDEMPYGDFLEIEGAKGAIQETAARLGLQWHRRILANYLEIFESLRKRRSLGFGDLTFDNFARVPRDYGALIAPFEKGEAPV